MEILPHLVNILALPGPPVLVQTHGPQHLWLKSIPVPVPIAKCYGRIDQSVVDDHPGLGGNRWMQQFYSGDNHLLNHEDDAGADDQDPCQQPDVVDEFVAGAELFLIPAINKEIGLHLGVWVFVCERE